MLDISSISLLIALAGFIYYFVYSRNGLWRKPMAGLFAVLVVCWAVLTLVFCVAHVFNRAFPAWPLHVVQACFGATMGTGAYLRYRREVKSA